MPEASDTFRLHQELLKKVISHLGAMGYDAASIGLDVPLPGGRRPDIVVVDPSTREYLAIIEVKTYSDETVRKNRSNIANELHAFRSSTRKLDLPVFIITPVERGENDPFRVYSLSEEGQTEQVNVESIPTFNGLRNSELTKSLKMRTDQRDDTLSLLQRLSWSSACVLLAVLLLSIFGYWAPTAEQLALIGAILALLLLPFASKLKILGVEFERYSTDKKDD